MRSIENVGRAITRKDWIKPGTPSRQALAARVREMACRAPRLMGLLEPLLVVLASMIGEFARLTKRVLDIAKHDKTCRQLLTSPRRGLLAASLSGIGSEGLPVFDGIGPISSGAAGTPQPR